jgi:hypothetical protein
MREELSPLGAASCQDLATRSCLYSLEKPMTSLSYQVARLVFHTIHSIRPAQELLEGAPQETASTGTIIHYMHSQIHTYL